MERSLQGVFGILGGVTQLVARFAGSEESTVSLGLVLTGSFERPAAFRDLMNSIALEPRA